VVARNPCSVNSSSAARTSRARVARPVGRERERIGVRGGDAGTDMVGKYIRSGQYREHEF